MEREQPAFWEKHPRHLLLIGIGFLVYFNGLFGAFIWDDISQIKDNYIIQSLSNIPGFFLQGTFVPTTSEKLMGGFYRPLMTTWFSIIYALFGLQPFFFHFFQLILHILNTLLVFVFLKKLLKEKLAFFLALVFLVHPMNVHVVSYISAVNDPLYFFFGILALVISAKEHISRKRAVAIGLLLLCSLLSKETGVLFLIILVVYQVIFRYRKFHRAQTVLLAVVPFLVFVYLRFVVAKMVLVQKLHDVPIRAIALSQRVFTMPAIVLYYLKTFFFPKDSFDMQYWVVTRPGEQFYAPLLLDSVFFLGITLFGVWIYRKRNNLFSLFLFFTIWFLIGVGLHMQLLPLDFTVSDSWFYFPMVGILGMTGIALETVQHPSVRLRNIATVVTIAVLILFSLRSIIQNTYWQDGLSLYNYNMQNINHSERVETKLALELESEGRLDEAWKLFENLVTRYPVGSGTNDTLVTNYERVMLVGSLATLDYSKGDIPQAKAWYDKILEKDGGEAYAALALIAVKREGNPQEAKNLAVKGLQKYPTNPDLWEMLALADYTLGNRQDALIEAKKATDILPSPGKKDFYNRILNNDIQL